MKLEERLGQESVVLLDGGIGTEIQRHGIAMDRRAWCGAAHMSHPEVVRRIHEDYICAGAEIITANTFATARHVLESAGLGKDFETINRRAVEVAKEARDSVARQAVWVAGSLSSMPPLTDISVTARGKGLEDNYRRQAEILAEAGADLLLLEMMIDREGALPVVSAAERIGLPLWVGFSASVVDTGQVTGFHTQFEACAIEPEDFSGLVEEILAVGGDVAGVMHSEIADTGPALEVLGRHFSGPLLAYAETGRFVAPNWIFEQTMAPDDYAAVAEGWVKDQGVRIVGGCCGTGPEHIRALKARFAPGSMAL